MDWLRLIRWKNLLIIFLTQFLVWYCLIFNSGIVVGWQFCVNFMLLCGSTMLIAAAGYIINDYFDIKIDVINRPEKVVLEKKIDLRLAIVAHTAVNVIALLMAGFVARHHWEWLLPQVISTVLLWFYSTHFKKQFIVGNVVVALLTAFTIIVLLIYAPALGLHDATQYAPGQPQPIDPFFICYGYAFFAFMLTWMREIVKDMEDYKGDAEQGCITMPIKKGLNYSAKFTIGLAYSTIGVLALTSLYFYLASEFLLGLYLDLLITLPIFLWTRYLVKENSVAHYHAASRWLKIIMLSGLGSLVLYYLVSLKDS